MKKSIKDDFICNQKAQIDALRIELNEQHLILCCLLFMQQLESEAENERKPRKKV
jgi:hypothetical protein